MSPSYQLPDLLSLSRAYELRTNRFCRAATTSSEAWLLSLKTADNNDVLTLAERTALHPMKAGLLAAVCFPDCDLPQLRFLTDFMSALLLSAGRLQNARNPDESGWRGVQSEAGAEHPLGHHELLQYLQPELDRFAARAPSVWKIHFAHAVDSYRVAQLQMITNRMSTSIPDPETYVALRRDLSGLYMIFDLVQLAQNLTSPSMDHDVADRFSRLKQYAAEVIACSLDVVAFNNDQAQENRHNLISILITHKKLSIQGALTFAGTMIKQILDAFVATERSLLNSLISPPPDPSENISSFRMWSSYVRMTTTSTSPAAANPIFLDDLPSYIQVLKDCIVGTINWAYETELYFGTKGEEIRTFGWIFLAPKIEAEYNSSYV